MLVTVGYDPMLGEACDFLAWVGRARKARYTYGDMDVLEKDEGTVVYAQGRVHGEFPDGVAFSAVRYIDRVTLVGERILRKEV